MSSKFKWAVLLLLLAAVIAGVTYGVFFTPYTALRNMLPVPNKLITVVFIVNGGKFNWGLRLTSEQFSANDLLEGRRDIKEFWPDFVW
jgi:hypothetical protein